MVHNYGSYNINNHIITKSLGDHQPRCPPRCNVWQRYAMKRPSFGTVEWCSVSPLSPAATSAARQWGQASGGLVVIHRSTWRIMAHGNHASGSELSELSEL